MNVSFRCSQIADGCQHTRGLREWVTFFLRGVAEQARDAVVRAQCLQDLQTAWRTKYQRARGAGLLLGIVDALFVSPVVSPSRQTIARLASDGDAGIAPIGE